MFLARDEFVHTDKARGGVMDFELRESFDVRGNRYAWERSGMRR